MVLDPAVWAEFGCTLVEVHPDGERWPVEIEDERRPDGRLEVTSLSSPERPMFFTWLDVVGAAVASKRVPRIVTATRYVGVGRQSHPAAPRRCSPALSSMPTRTRCLPSSAPVGGPRPAGDQRRAAVLRLVVNSLVFGVLSRFDEVRRRDAKGLGRGRTPGAVVVSADRLQRGRRFAAAAHGARPLGLGPRWRRRLPGH